MARGTRSSGATYARLEPQVRSVSAGVVKKRWKKLSNSAQESVRNIILNASHHDHSSNLSRKRSTVAEDACIREVQQRLIERLPRMPFPPSLQDETFDFEQNLNKIRGIEENLTADTHSINLLRTQIKWEERMLGQDRQEVESLKESLKANDNLRKHQQKTLHSIATDIGKALEHGGTSTANSSARQELATVVPKDLERLLLDPSFMDNIEQLRSHLGSMQSNVHSIIPVVAAINKADQSLALIAQSNCAGMP